MTALKRSLASLAAYRLSLVLCLKASTCAALVNMLRRMTLTHIETQMDGGLSASMPRQIAQRAIATAVHALD